MSELKRTPLYENHKELKARMVPFGGWEMPIQYKGVIAEHKAVRNEAGLFDVSHMGEFIIQGKNAKAFLNKVTTNDVDKLYDGRLQYTLFCYENGTVVDDLIVARLNEDRYLAIVNASNIDKDFAWLEKNAEPGVELINQSSDWALLAVQGIRSTAILVRLFGKEILTKYYHFEYFEYQNQKLFVSRTGYTCLLYTSDAADES